MTPLPQQQATPFETLCILLAITSAVVAVALHIALIGLRKQDSPAHKDERLLNIIFKPEKLTPRGSRIRLAAILCYTLFLALTLLCMRFR